MVRAQTVSTAANELGGNLRPPQQIPVVNYHTMDHDSLKRSVNESAELTRRTGRSPRSCAGLFVVSGRESGGRDRKAPTLGWIDTDAGRYLTTTSTDQHGDTRTTFLPADETRVAHKLGELLGSVRPAVSRPW